MGSQWSQFFPPAPTLAANDGDCQHGKVFFVIGDYSCIGLELAKMIYNKQTRVYLASRSGQAAMQAIKGMFHSYHLNKIRNYTNTKTGNLFLASEFAKRAGAPHNIISCAINPEAVRSNLFKHAPWLLMLAWIFKHNAELGATTALYKGLSKDIIRENNGCYILPWGGVVEYVKGNLDNAIKSKEDGGSGAAQEFRELCEENTRDYR
ncbi:short-chain dehydrogenase [Seiridium cupressi]